MFWERFYALCIKKGTKPNPLGSKIGISSGVITKWKNGSIPNGETLLRLSDELDCSVDYLLGKANSTNGSINDLPEKEKRLISAYRNQPDIQLAVDRLLGIDAPLQIHQTMKVDVAAAGGDKSTIGANVSAEELGNLLDQTE